MCNIMNILFSSSYLEFDILLLILFIICCISIYNSISSSNRYDTVESFQNTCCIERFQVVKIMNTIVDELENKINEISQMQKQNIKPDDIKKKLQRKIATFDGVVQDTESKLKTFKTKFYKYHKKAQEREQAQKEQASSGT